MSDAKDVIEILKISRFWRPDYEGRRTPVLVSDSYDNPDYRVWLFCIEGSPPRLYGSIHIEDFVTIKAMKRCWVIRTNAGVQRIRQKATRWED